MSALRRSTAIFDLDGTLSESAPGITGALAYAFGAAGLAVPEAAVLRSAIGPNFVDVFPTLGVPLERVDEVIGHYRVHYEGDGLFDTELYDGVIDLLDELSAREVTLAVATSKPITSATTVLTHLGIADRFAVIQGAVHERGISHKADVVALVIDELGLTADAAGRRPQVVMIGDRIHDIEGAGAHGIDTIAVGWGYGSLAEHEAAGAAALAAEPADVVALLDSGF